MCYFDSCSLEWFKFNSLNCSKMTDSIAVTPRHLLQFFVLISVKRKSACLCTCNEASHWSSIQPKYTVISDECICIWRSVQLKFFVWPYIIWCLDSFIKSKLWWMLYGDMTDYGHATIIWVLLWQITHILMTLKALCTCFMFTDFTWTTPYSITILQPYRYIRPHFPLSLVKILFLQSLCRVWQSLAFIFHTILKIGIEGV